MPIIKCKMCGGDLNLIEGSTVCECDSCGRKQTVPSADNEKKLTLFGRAGRLLRGCEFDKAAGVFETIVTDFPQEAEAYWGLVLCKYGIEYVDDPATGKKIPTCHRSSFDSVLDDSNFEQACENTDAVARRVYRDEARQIEELRQAILQVSGKEEPYDVFISYKETDEHGERTLDSVIAQDIYKELTNEGYRVFFSRISLEDKLGTEYEPYIFAALNSAKVMLVVGTDYENFDSVWVKNEWSRFLKLIAKGEKKTLIPVFKNMDAYDMPKEFAKLAAQDMGKVGAMQDLVRGVEKIVGRKKAEPAQAQPVQQPVYVSGGPNVTAMIERGHQALEDGDWAKADEFFDQALNMNAKCAEAFLGKFLAQEKAVSLDTALDNRLAECDRNVNTEFSFIDKNVELCNRLVEEFTIPGYLERVEIERMLDYDLSYPSTAVSRSTLYDKETNRLRTNQLFRRASYYADDKISKMIENAVRRFENSFIQRLQEAHNNEIDIRQKKEKEYEAFLVSAEKNIKEQHTRCLENREKDYQTASKQLNEANSSEEYQYVAELFIALRNYKNSAEKARIADEKATAIEKEQYEAAEKAKSDEKARKKKITISLSVIAVIVFAAALLLTQVIIPAKKYEEAAFLEETGEISRAAIAFGRLGSYKDAHERSQALWDHCAQRDSIAASGSHTVGLLSSGKVVAVGRNIEGECDVTGWTNVIAVSVGYYHSVGLRSDGSVVAVGRNDSGQCNVSDWRDIVAIAGGGYHTVGLRADGTVVAVGSNSNGQCNVSEWRDIVAIAADWGHTVGLKSDGTVIAIGDNQSCQCDVSQWTDIVAIAAGTYHTVGLRSDGTVVLAGSRTQDDVRNWTGIVAVAAGCYHTVGLQIDGTVVATGESIYGQCDVSAWSDIVAVAGGTSNTVGLLADGTAVSTAFINLFRDRQYFGQCDVSDWRDIKLPEN